MISNHFRMGSVQVCICANKDTSIVDRKMSDVVDEAKPFPLPEQIELDIRDIESRYGFSSCGEQRAQAAECMLAGKISNRRNNEISSVHVAYEIIAFLRG